MFMGGVLAFHWTAFFESIQQATVAVGVVTFSTFPVFTSIFEPIVYRQKIRKNAFFLALIALAGVALIVPSFDLNHQYTVGAMWGIASGASFAILALASKKMMLHYNSNDVSFYQNTVAALVLCLFFWRDIQQGTQIDWMYLLILGIVFTGIAHTLFINSMKGMQAYTASLITCLEPFYGIILAWLILQETPSGRMLVGGLLILAVASYASIAEKN
jgi:drug/metabolite transporter (DMT)-like permease